MYKGITEKHLAVKELCGLACMGIKIMYHSELQRVVSHRLNIVIESPVELSIVASGGGVTKFLFKGKEISLNSTLKDKIMDSQVHLFVELGLNMPVILDTYFRNVVADTRSSIDRRKSVIEADLVEEAL